MAFQVYEYDLNYGAKLTQSLATTAGVAVAKGQLVKFGADDDTVTGTTAANDANVIGFALEAVTSGEAGANKRVLVELLTPGTVRLAIAGGTVTRGTKQVVQGTDGRVVDIGAAAVGDARAIVGIALKSATVGQFVPVLITC